MELILWGFLYYSDSITEWNSVEKNWPVFAKLDTVIMKLEVTLSSTLASSIRTRKAEITVLECQIVLQVPEFIYL
jgi:hypothetical protein